MKKVVASAWSLIGLLTISISPYSMASGGMEGGGGDIYANEFVAVGRDVVRHLSILSSVDRRGVEPEALLSAIERTSVESTDTPLVLDGRQVDAINYPSVPKILLSRSAWDRVHSIQRKKSLVLHEYAGILGVDDSKYQISTVIFPEGGFRENPCESDVRRMVRSVVSEYKKLGFDVVEESFSVATLKPNHGSPMLVLEAFLQANPTWIAILHAMAECDPGVGKYELLTRDVRRYVRLSGPLPSPIPIPSQTGTPMPVPSPTPSPTAWR